MNYSEYQDVAEALKACQEADIDNRERSRESIEFLYARDGQWEPGIFGPSDNDKPRYTFDLTSPIVDQIADDIDQLDFGIDVKPAGGDASKEDAKIYNGLIRNIESISDAETTYELEGRAAVEGGFGAWYVKADYADADSFDQDLLICPIANSIDSVWPGPFTKPDASDMEYCYVLEAIPKDEYDDKHKDRAGQGLSQGKWSNAFYHKPDTIIVGQIYYLEQEKRELLLMSNGQVIEDSEDNRKVLDELEAQGVTVSDRRNQPRQVCMTRLFDGEGWMTEPKRTVFSSIPVVLVLGNLKFYENKILYHGSVDKLIDPQRVFNYAKSREIEEGALAPRAKKWMTQEQAKGFEDQIATMNTNADPVQFYNHVEGQPPPFDTGGAQINPGLSKTSDDMHGIMRGVGGVFDASMGDNPNMQSGVAIERLQNRGDVGSRKYIKALERAIARTGSILVDAIPRVYDTRRQVRVMKEDGSYDLTTLNDAVFDQQTMEWVTVNDLSKGKYDVVCKAGPAFDNRQQKTVSALTEMAQYDPALMQEAGDVIFRNISAPGMDLIADRKRKQLFEAGAIPVEQMTDEELALFQQMQQQPPQPDPMMLAAQAEMEKATVEREANQVKLAVEQEKVRLEALKLQIQQGEQQLKGIDLQLKAQREAVQNESQLIENEVVRQKFGLEARKTTAETNKTVAETAKTVKETRLMGTGNA